jgi:4-hydroxyproline epimerase
VGVITATLHENGEVSVRNVPAWRHQKAVSVEVEGFGVVTGDTAWGGNWFYLVQDHGQSLDIANTEALTELTWRIRQSLAEQGITGENGAEIDHIELFSPPHNPSAHSRNFVLCPGKAYDRSPCGTGTSAKLACLYADGKLKAGEVWRQESITGSVFEGTLEVIDKVLFPTIRGSAYVNAESTLLLNTDDPLCWGIR